MIVKGIIDEDFVNYKVPSMNVVFPRCSFKCEKECGLSVCHNSTIAKEKDINVLGIDIVKRYMNNPITKAVVFNGLEPFDSFMDMMTLINIFRQYTNDTVVIYTGYNEEEISEYINSIRHYGNIIVKFGRYVPNCEPHFDDVLGVCLASDNQYAVEI